MNVVISKSIHDPEQVIPSLVWLEPADQFLSGGGKVLYFSLSIRQFKFLPIASNGKANFFGTFPIGNRKTARQIVQSGAQMENHLTDYHGQHFRNGCDQEFNRLVHAIGLHLTNNSVRTAESLNDAFDIRDVFIGPSDLDFDTI